MHHFSEIKKKLKQFSEECFVEITRDNVNAARVLLGGGRTVA